MIYYTYELWNPIKNEPFYVGKGKHRGTSRFRDHLRLAMQEPEKGNRHKNYTICQILEAKQIPDFRIVFTADNESAVLQKEVELIKQYGRRDLGTGCLTNMTDGGDGTSGIIMSNELREKKRQRMSGQGNHMYGRSRTKEERDTISKTRKERIEAGLIVIQHSEAHKEKLRLDNPGGRAAAQPILQIDPSTGMVLKRHESALQAGKFLNKNGRSIAPACGKYKHRLKFGFYWRWEDDLDVVDGKMINIILLNEHRQRYRRLTCV